MSADNVTPIRPGIAGAAPVTNPKTRGRQKGTISLRAERRRRETQVKRDAESVYHPSVKIAAPERGRFHYPKELLLQKCICKNSYGWMLPNLSASALSNQKPVADFVSPLNQLLSQLEAEGARCDGSSPGAFGHARCHH